MSLIVSRKDLKIDELDIYLKILHTAVWMRDGVVMRGKPHLQRFKMT